MNLDELLTLGEEVDAEELNDVRSVARTLAYESGMNMSENFIRVVQVLTPDEVEEFVNQYTNDLNQVLSIAIPMYMAVAYG